MFRKISVRSENLLKVGLFLAAAASLVGLLAANSLWVSKFKMTAMRFVPSEAVSFVVVPDLESFMTYGSSPFRAIVSNLTAKSADSDFVALLVPPPKLENVELPTPCIKLRSLSDLEEAGIDARGSASVARLDSGSRITAQVKDDSRAMAFLADVVNPVYLRLSVPMVDREKKDGDDQEADEATYKFSIALSPKGISICFDQTKPENKTGVVYVPLRVLSSAPGVEPAVEVDCSVETGEEGPKSCKCELVVLGLGDNQSGAAHFEDCRKPSELVERPKRIAKLGQEVRSGKTVTIGNHYLAKFDEFYVLESLSNKSAPRNFKISEPRSSIVRDDSFLKHFEEMLDEGKQYSSTVLAGARPDWVLENAAAGLRGIPLYLMTPIGLHFRADDVYVRALTNLEPQDMAVIQMLAARDKQEATPKSWSRWRDGLGAKISDSSLKTYAHFVRSYFPDADLRLQQVAPLGPAIIDVMEEDASALVASVADVSEDGKSARLAIAVPDISAEYAGRLVGQVRRQIMLRQAKLTVERASRYAMEMGIRPSRLLTAVPRLMCISPIYEIKSIVVKNFDKDSPAAAVINSTIILSDTGLSPAASWPASKEDGRLQRLLPFEDANAALWGEGYARTNGHVRTDQQRVQEDIKELVDVLSELEAVADENGPFRERLAEQGLRLLQMARSLETRRSSIYDQVHLSAAIESVLAGDSEEALVALKSLNGELQEKLDNNSSMKPADVKLACESIDKGVKASPVALYDQEVRTLYLLDSVEQAATLPKASEQRDAVGKLLMKFDTVELVELLRRGKAPSSTIEQVEKFPFSGIRFSLAGRDTGAGAEGRLYFTKMGSKP